MAGMDDDKIVRRVRPGGMDADMRVSSGRRGDPGKPQGVVANIARRVDAGVRGAADMLTLGYADEIAAGGDALLGVGGEGGLEARYSRNIAAQRTRDAADVRDVKGSRRIGQAAGIGASIATGAIAGAARAVPTVLKGGGMVGNVLRGGVVGGAYGGVEGSGRAKGTISERLPAARQGALFGAGLGAASVPASIAAGAVTAVAGRGINALLGAAMPLMQRKGNALARREPAVPVPAAPSGPRPPRPNTRRAASGIANRTPLNVDVPAMRARRDEMRAAGVQPSAVDVVDESGRAVFRVAGSKMGPGRQVVVDAADAASLALPERIPQRFREFAAPGASPRTPDEIIDGLIETRRTAAEANYAGPYSEPVEMTEQVWSALSDRDGRAALTRAYRAAEARRDRAAMAEINDLRAAIDDPALQGAVPTTTGRVLDRAQIALSSTARNMRTSTTNRQADIAGGLEERARDVNGALDTAPGLREARAAYAGDTRNIEAAEAARQFVTGPSDNIIPVFQGAGDLTGAREVATRSVSAAADRGTGAAPGLARSFARAPGLRDRTNALLGPETGSRVQNAMQAELDVVNNRAFINPNTGSQTFSRGEDAAGFMEGAKNVARAAGGGLFGAVDLAVMTLRRNGMGAQEAEALARVAVDPARVDEFIDLLEERIGFQAAQAVLRTLRPAAGRTAGGIAAPDEPAL